MKTAALLLAATFAVPALRAAEGAKPKTDLQKTLYAIGASVAEEYQLEASETAFVIQGLSDAASGGKLAVEPAAQAGPVRQLKIDREAKRSQAWLDKMAKRKGAIKTSSGLIYRELKAGSGPKPEATSVVRVHYRGTFVNGTEFDSSYGRGQPAEFPLNGVIRCWTEGVQRMSVGTKAELICPYAIAYGEMGRPPAIPPRSTLVFEVELLDIVGAR